MIKAGIVLLAAISLAITWFGHDPRGYLWAGECAVAFWFIREPKVRWFGARRRASAVRPTPRVLP